MSNKVATFAQRLRAGLDMRQITQSDLARLSGVSKSSISRYLKGDWEGKQGAVYALAKTLGVTEAWLMGYDVSMDADSSPDIPPGFIPLPETRKVPLVGRIACGTPITAEENIEDYVDAPKDHRVDFALLCEGDSMIDAGIDDGDIVYIRKQPDVENGQIAAVRIGEEATLKRVYKEADRVVLMPANSAYLPLTYVGEQINAIAIEGRAVGWTHWV